MKKHMLVAGGVGLAAAASLTLGAPAGAATQTSKLVAFHSIAAAPKVPFAGKCGYPVNNPVLVLGPAAQSAKKFHNYHFGGSYGCNGHGLANYKVSLTSSSNGSGACTSTAGKGGSFACLLTARASGTATAYAFRATSNSVGVKLKG